MMAGLNGLILRTTDAVVGWLLNVPSDVALFALAVIGAAIQTAARRFTTDQDLLRRCNADKKRLRELIGEAKRRGDADAVRRHRATQRMVAAKAGRCETRPLLVSLIPIVFIGIWAFQRMAWHPPRTGEAIAVQAYFPIAAAGQVAHMVPADGLTADEGWIQEIHAVNEDGPPHGMATWHVRAAAPGVYDLTLRRGSRSWVKRIRVGERTYEPPQTFYDDDLLCIETKLNAIKLFGIVPGIRALALPPWLIAYLLVTIPAMSLLKRVLKIE